MNKYVVKLTHVFSTITEVEGANKEDALDAAEKWFVETTSKEDAKLFYEGTMDKKSWAVLTLEEYEELKEKIKQELENKKEENSNIIVP